MIPVKLKLFNFTSYGENVGELDFTKFHLAAISGPNGAGKSSLLDAITWCVWGWSRSGDNADQLVRLGSHEMYVEFSFDLDGHTFTTKRVRSLKSGGISSLELWSGVNNLTEGTIKSTQQKIIDLLHLSFETFTNSSFLRQGHADEFTTKGPNDRKRILADILGLSHYDKLEISAREKVKEADNQLKLLEYQLLELEAELSSKEDSQSKKKEAELQVTKVDREIKSLEDVIKTLREEREALNIINQQRVKLLQNLSENKIELESLIKDGLDKKNRIEDLKKEKAALNVDEKLLLNLSDLQYKKDFLEKIKQRRLEIESQKAKQEYEISKKDEQIRVLQEDLDELDKKLVMIKKEGAKCPTCGQEVGLDHKVSVQKNLEQQKNEIREKVKLISKVIEERQLSNLIKELQTLKFNDKEYLELTEKLSNLENQQRQKEKLIAINATLAAEEKMLEQLRDLYSKKKIQVDKLQGEINSHPDILEKLNSINTQILEDENLLNNLKADQKKAQEFLGQVTELISRAKQLENVQKEKLGQKDNWQKEKGAYEELSLAFGKKGIQAMIIETAIPEIETETNKLLSRLTDGRMMVELKTQRETKTKLEDGEKGIIETLDIIISDEMGDRPYEMYSGGEAFRVNFAIRLALSKLLTRRAGAKLQFLVIDEGFGTQDVEGRTKIVEVLDTIKDDFEKVLIITHLDELKEEFPVRIEVSKSATGSTFEVIGV